MQVSNVLRNLQCVAFLTLHHALYNRQSVAVSIYFEQLIGFYAIRTGQLEILTGLPAPSIPAAIYFCGGFADPKVCLSISSTVGQAAVPVLPAQALVLKRRASHILHYTALYCQPFSTVPEL
jgi:hypothetical protein